MTDIEYLEKYLPKEKLKEGLSLLEKKVPLQYIVGNTDFCDINLTVNENVLIPRFETEYLTQKTIDYIRKYFKEKVKILDMATGSGAIAICLKKHLNAEVSASDISKEALKVAKENAKKNHTIIHFYESDLFQNIKGKFDVIISNPPYIAYGEKIDEKVLKYEPALALFAKDNGLYFYKEILKNAKNYLNEKNIIAFEIGETQKEEITLLALKYFPSAKVLVFKDLPGKDRYIFIFNGL